MTIDEAIKTQRLIVDYPKTPIGLNTLRAMKLGIEALKWIKWRREHYQQPPILPLQGETEE